jgi:hypothetical protein
MAEEPRDEMMEELFGTSDNDSDDERKDVERVSIPDQVWLKCEPLAICGVLVYNCDTCVVG